MSKYAENTTVAVDQTLGEIKRTLLRFGAESFGTMESAGKLQIAFKIRGLNVLMQVSLPKQDEFATTESGRHRQSQSVQFAAWEKECRRRARSLAAVIKAKLVAIDDKVATLEAEFLPYIVMANGISIGDHLIPKLPSIISGNLALAAGRETT